jgi:hypothetical protein
MQADAGAAAPAPPLSPPELAQTAKAGESALAKAYAAERSSITQRIDRQAIAQAIKQAAAADDAVLEKRIHTIDSYRAGRYEAFGAAFAEARVPDCLHGDALKRQPPVIGFIGVTGQAQWLFVLLAKLRGKCN